MTDLRLSLVEKPTFAEMMIERGLNAENRLLGLKSPEEIAIFVRDENGVIIGGAQGELEWDWLYVDLLWLHESQRDKGMGRQIMIAIEQGAREQGYLNCWLATTGFQARPFYEAIGYQVFGQVENRPPGYDYFFLQKTEIASMPTILTVEMEPEQHDIDTLRKSLADHTRQQGVAVDGRRLAVFLEDSDGGVLGGLIAATYWGWLDIQVFWLAESVRGQGYGRRMLAMAEQESKRRGCPHAFADVPSFQALSFFEYHGYQTFGVLEDRPLGHRTHFMRKDL